MLLPIAGNLNVNLWKLGIGSKGESGNTQKPTFFLEQRNFSSVPALFNGSTSRLLVWYEWQRVSHQRFTTLKQDDDELYGS